MGEDEQRSQADGGHEGINDNAGDREQHEALEAGFKSDCEAAHDEHNQTDEGQKDGEHGELQLG